jgi:hypothetical protein
MLEINASKINNVVTFTVDHNSLREAKKAGDDLQKYFQSIAEPKLRFKQIRERQRKAAAMADNAKFNTSPSSTSELKQQRIADKAAKTQAREAAKIAKRNETADLKFRSANLQMKGIAGKYGIDPLKQLEFSRFAKEQTELFRNGQISSQKLNHEIRERITLMRRQAALQARITASTQQQAAAQRKGKRMDYKGAAADIKERGLNLIGGGKGFVAATAALAGGAGVLSRIKQQGDENLELVRMSERTKLNVNAVKAIVTWGQQHGVDSASVDKITDGFGKDTREKISETLMNSKLDQKSGKYKGGNSNIEEILNKFGWNKSEIKQYEDNPLDFIQATVNEGQRRGYSDGELAHLLENIFDDGAHYLDLFKNNGEQFMSTLKKLVDSGQTLNDEQIRQVATYGDLSVAMGNLMNGVDNSLFTGFMSSFADSGDELVKNTQAINQSAGLLGEGLGNLASQMTAFASEISGVVSALNSALRQRFPEWFTDKDEPAAQAVYDGVTGSADSAAGWIQKQTGWNPQTVAPAIRDWLGIGDEPTGTAINQYNLNGQALRDNTISSLVSSANTPSFNLAPVFNLQVNPQVGLTLQSDVSRLSDFIDFNAKASADSFTRSLTLSALSGQPSTGG